MSGGRNTTGWMLYNLENTMAKNQWKRRRTTVDKTAQKT
jgi:hypothetical protein